MLHMMVFLVGKPPTVLPGVGEWSVPLFGAAAAFCNYSAAVLKAVIVVSQCNEILLSTALAFTNSLAFYLSTMLRLNAFFRLTLTGVIFSQEELHQRGPTQTCRSSSRSPLCCVGGRTVSRLKSALHAVSAICCCLLSVCMALIHVAPMALSTLCRDFRPRVSTIRTLCGCTRALLSTLQTVTGFCTRILKTVCSVLSLISSS